MAYAPALSIGSPLATYQTSSSSSISRTTTSVRSTTRAHPGLPGHRHAGQHGVGPARQLSKHPPGIRGVGRLAEDLPVDHDRGIGANHDGVAMARQAGRRFLASQSFDVDLGQLTRPLLFVDVDRLDHDVNARMVSSSRRRGDEEARTIGTRG